MILLIDNYDSFAYNLYQMVGEIAKEIKVIRNDTYSVAQIAQLNPQAIILSPGPGRPEDAGVCQEVITRLGHKIPILGVCLGHQAICQVFGATITHAPQLMHGKSSYIQINQESPLFKEIAAPMQVARYHSLIAQKETIPECLKVIASTNEQEIMAVNHQTYPIFGVQFHPESILTPNGRKLLANFIQFAQNLSISESFRSYNYMALKMKQPFVTTNKRLKYQ